MEDYFDIKRWLSDNEKVVYDTGSNNLTVNNGKENRGIVTDSRTIFLGHGKKNEIFHNSVTSINHQYITRLTLIIIGIPLSIIGIGLIYWSFSYSPSFGFTVFLVGLSCLFISIFLIIQYFRTKKYKLKIFTDENQIIVTGPKETLQKIKEEISSKRGKPPEEKEQICKVCGTKIPGGKTVCPSCGDIYS